jgi:eukaryotic-like serine/threonine-protein kinase
MSPEPTTPLDSIAGDIGAGHVLGRYELLMPIAAGGMAMVWAARMKGTRGFQKIVAVKTMLPKLSEDPAFEQMFLDEASLASQVRHPHVVEILDLGEQDGVLYLVMEWIDGTPLNHLMRAAKTSGGIPLPIGVRIVMHACGGLQAAHELRDDKGQLVGLVHRDISPQNVLVTFDGVTKVVDFGVAKATALGGGATAAGQIKGKIAYMAPEQIKGATIDRRVDVFAMGVVLYALTTGKHPFRKESEAATMYRICSPEPAMSPRKLVPGYPAALERVVMQALAKDPAKRYPTANDLLRALDQSLPQSMRVSTDEGVAAFVRGLIGDKQEERRAQLQLAIETAEQRAQHKRLSLREVLDSNPPPPPIGSVTPSGADLSVSSTAVSRMSQSSVHDIGPLSTTHPTLSSAHAGALVAEAGQPPVGRKPRTGLVLGGLVVAVAVVIGSVMMLGGGSAKDSTAAAPPVAAPTSPTEPVAEKPAEPEPKPEAVADPMPELEPAVTEPVNTAKAKPGGKSWKPSSAKNEPAKPAAADPPPKPATTKPQWKQDPGF